MFDFKRLIKKYSKGHVSAILEKEGYYDQKGAGKYVEGEKKEVEIFPAAIVPFSFNELRFDLGGNYNADDRKLYCYESFKKGTVIKNRMNDDTIRIYKIMENKDYSDFDEGLRIYILKRADNDFKDD